MRLHLEELLSSNLPSVNTGLFVLMNNWYYRSLDELLIFGCLYLYNILPRLCNTLQVLSANCKAVEKYCLPKTVKLLYCCELVLWLLIVKG